MRDYLADTATPEIGAAILGLSAAAAENAVRIAGFGAEAALQAEANAAPLPTGIRHLSSRARNTLTTLDQDAGLALAIDLLDAAGLDTNTPPGTLFSLYPAEATPEVSFLRPGTDQIAAGCFLHGPRTTLTLTTGHGTALFLLDRASGDFRLDAAELRMPVDTPEFSANAAEYRHWERPVQHFIDDCLSGDEGPRKRNFDMRWTGSLAAEAQRILSRGGIYLAPRGSASPLRLLHHCQPIAMLVEQAGGQATDGVNRILKLAATSLDATSPLVFGSPRKVARVSAYFDLPDNGASPLFSRRGLFRI
jgi:fructose-1,6-bisphosphatase I